MGVWEKNTFLVLREKSQEASSLFLLGENKKYALLIANDNHPTGWRKPALGRSQHYGPQSMHWDLAKAAEPLDHPTQKPPCLGGPPLLGNAA